MKETITINRNQVSGYALSKPAAAALIGVDRVLFDKLTNSGHLFTNTKGEYPLKRLVHDYIYILKNPTHIAAKSKEEVALEMAILKLGIEQNKYIDKVKVVSILSDSYRQTGEVIRQLVQNVMNRVGTKLTRERLRSVVEDEVKLIEERLRLLPNRIEKEFKTRKNSGIKS